MEINKFNYLFNTCLKFFFLFTPFFVLTMFLSVTKTYTEAKKRKLAIHVSVAVFSLCLIVFFFGNIIFNIFGITLDSFRVGAGALLFLSAVKLVQSEKTIVSTNQDDDIAVVPLAMPVVVGPATVGALLVLGGGITNTEQRVLGCAALMLAISGLLIILLLGSAINRAIGQRGLNVLSKITGLILSALAAQLILTGVLHFFSEKQ